MQRDSHTHFSIWRTHKNLTFSFYEFENDERFIETSFTIFITNFYSQLFTHFFVLDIQRYSRAYVSTLYMTFIWSLHPSLFRPRNSRLQIATVGRAFSKSLSFCYGLVWLQITPGNTWFVNCLYQSPLRDARMFI